MDHLWNWKRLQEFLDLWKLTNGAIPLGYRELIELLPDINAKSSAADLARRLKGMLALINYIISNDVPFYLYSYKINPSASGKPATAIISSKHDDPKQALESILDTTIGYFQPI